MKKAGFTRVYIGIENFHPSLLSYLGKSSNLIANFNTLSKNAIISLLAQDITPAIFLQVGIPGEDQDAREHNVRMLTRLGEIARRFGSEIELYLHLNVVYPGTVHFRKLVAKGVPEDIFEHYTKVEESEQIRSQLSSLMSNNLIFHSNGGLSLGILDLDALKKRKFVIKQDEVKAISSYIARMNNIPGVKVVGKDADNTKA